MSERMSDVDEDEYEVEGEDPGEGGGLVKHNPIGEYYGGRNDKNERHGRGRAVLPNGDLYLGCYFRGKRYGLGVYRYKNGNGARYGGDWVNGLKNGWGTMYFPDGSQYTGNWYRGVIHGWGVYVYSNGDEYEGWFFMGAKNGRGIYRTKSTNEKFVGSWLLGLKHGQGMIIRPEYRFIGNWYNDVPKGPGVYVFEDLGVEQHGRYSVVKLQEDSVPKYKALGYQILTMRTAAPPTNPVEVEANTRMALQMSDMYNDANAGEGDEGGEGFPPDSPSPNVLNRPSKENAKNPEEKKSSKSKGEGATEAKCDPEKKAAEAATAQSKNDEMEQKVMQKLKEFIHDEQEAHDNNQSQVALVWRASQMTRSGVTKYPDGTVPPPPIPETPMPEIETCGEDDMDSSGLKKSLLDEDEAIRQAKLLAKTHALGEIYSGSGVCQLPLAKIRWPDDFIPPRTFSKITVSTIEEFKNIMETIAPQLEPLDIQAIIAENLNVFRGAGINVSEKWKECLGNETECENVEMKGAPRQSEGGEDGMDKRKSGASGAGSRKNSQFGEVDEEFAGEDGGDGRSRKVSYQGGEQDNQQEEDDEYQRNEQEPDTEGEEDEDEFDF